MDFEFATKISLLKAAPLVVAALLVVGCDTVASENIHTDSVSAQITVHAAGDGSTRVEATLRAGDGLSQSYIELTEADSLLAIQGDMGMRMSRDDLSYAATFDGEEEGTMYRISLIRSMTVEGKECNAVSAPNSTAILPAPFELTGPGAPVSRQEPVQVTWTNTGKVASMEYALNGDCIRDMSGTTGDGGTLIITGIEPLNEEDAAAESCDVTITLTRKANGTLDRNYGEGGSIVAMQERKVSFLSTP